MTEYGYSVEVPAGYDETVIRTRLALRSEGFSILSESHVGGLLGPEAGAGRQYLIIGAWTPATSPHEMGAGLQVAVHLPCNMIVAESGNGATVAALDPAEDGADMSEELADGVRAALGRVLTRVSSQP